MSDRAFEVIIDEIVLHGAAVIDRERFRVQVAQELERLLEEEGGLALTDTAGSSGAVLTMPHVSIASAQTSDPSQLARVIHEAIKR